MTLLVYSYMYYLCAYIELCHYVQNIYSNIYV